MTPKQAIEILDQAVMQLRITRQEHVTMQKAVEVVRKFIGEFSGEVDEKTTPN